MDSVRQQYRNQNKGTYDNLITYFQTMWNCNEATKFCYSIILKITLTISVIAIFNFFVMNIKQRSVGLYREYSDPFLNWDHNFLFPSVRELRFMDKEYSNEQVRIVGLPSSETTKVSTRIVSQKLIYSATEYYISKYNIYYVPELGSETFTRYSCPVNQCTVTNDPKKAGEANAIIFHMFHIKSSKPPVTRRPDQLYILYYNEAPWARFIDFRKFDGFFNWTMGYRSGSDIMVKYGFVGRRPETVNLPDVIPSREIFKKKENLAVWYVSKCCTYGNREEYVSQLMQHYPVRILGGCAEEDCLPPQSDFCYRDAAQKYKFILAFENSVCLDYVTEKLFDALEYGIIPVVFGGVDYSAIVPPHSIINALDFNGPKELAEHLWLVSQDYHLYVSFFKWKEHYRSYLYPWMCDLCKALHSDHNQVSVKSSLDLSIWWNSNSNRTCQTWTKDKFISISDDKIINFFDVKGLPVYGENRCDENFKTAAHRGSNFFLKTRPRNQHKLKKTKKKSRSQIESKLL